MVFSHPVLSVGYEVPDTEAEGPFRRYAIWLRGCPMRCPGCCNPELFEPAAPSTPVDELIDRIRSAEGIEGISILGGEPFAQARAAGALAEAAHEIGLGVVVFSGYRLAEIETQGADAQRLLAKTDLLVDGPFEHDNPDHERRWIGSANQELHFLTDRYDPDDPQFRSADSFEVRFVNGTLLINGVPHQSGLLTRDAKH